MSSLSTNWTKTGQKLDMNYPVCVQTGQKLDKNWTKNVQFLYKLDQNWTKIGQNLIFVQFLSSLYTNWTIHVQFLSSFCPVCTQTGHVLFQVLPHFCPRFTQTGHACVVRISLKHIFPLPMGWLAPEFSRFELQMWLPHSHANCCLLGMTLLLK